MLLLYDNVERQTSKDNNVNRRKGGKKKDSMRERYIFEKVDIRFFALKLIFIIPLYPGSPIYTISIRLIWDENSEGDGGHRSAWVLDPKPSSC